MSKVPAHKRRRQAPLELKADKKSIQKLFEIHRLGLGLPTPREAGSTQETTIYSQVQGSEETLARDLRYKARRFATRYSPSELEFLVRLFRKHRAPLSWSHVVPLLSLNPAKPEDRRLRRSLEKLAAENKWSCDRLSEELRRQRSDKRQRTSGRKVQPVSSLSTFAKMLHQWSRRLADPEPPKHDASARRSLFDRFTEMPRKELGEHAAEIAEAILAAEGLHAVVGRRINELQSIQQQCSRRSK